MRLRYIHLVPTFEPTSQGNRRLREERRNAGLSLARLAEMSGISRTYLLKLEKDEASNPSLEVLRRLADALDITVADLLGTPPMQFELDDAALPQSLRAFADETQLAPKELQMLASIRWRKGQEPKSSERWRFILDSLRASRQLDDDVAD
jgi:XRE family transcriptional regulator of biofilm formation